MNTASMRLDGWNDSNAEDEPAPLHFTAAFRVRA